MKAIEIFRPGTHRAMSGKDMNFSADDVAATAKAYDPALHEAPLVVGHPAHDGPAYGWVKGLSYENGHLVATPDQVNPAFAELVASGAYKKVSACFYAPGASGNPTPDTYYLRHVGFLGAKPPAVKGLSPIAFADDAGDLVSIEIDGLAFGEMQSAGLTRGFGMIAGFFQRWRDRLIEAEGVEAADHLISPYELGALRDLASESEGETTPSFSEAEIEPESEQSMSGNKQECQKTDASVQTASVSAEERAAFDADREKLDADRAAFAEERRTARKEADKAFVDTLVAEGKLAPGMAGEVTAFMETLDDKGLIAFGEGDDEKTPYQAFKDMLARAGSVVNFAEVSPDDGDSAGRDAPLSAQEIATEALAFQETEKARGRHVSTVAAVAHVRAMQPTRKA